MSTQTPNLNLDLREGTDIFNPLSTNANFETLDSVITEIRKKGGVPTYTTTASANLLKLSENPVPNETLFKFVAAGDANTWSYQETVNNIVALDGKQKTVKGGEMYVAWVNAANSMVVIAWPDIVDAQTFDGKGPAEWASKAQLDAVNQTAANATTTAQAAATVANNALQQANDASEKAEQALSSNNWRLIWSGTAGSYANNAVLNLSESIATPCKLKIIAKAVSVCNYYFEAIIYWDGTKNNSAFMISQIGNVVDGTIDNRQFSVVNGNSLKLSSGYAVHGESSETRSDVAVPYKIYKQDAGI